MTTMFRMRPARVEDRPEIETLIRARAAWMRERELPGWEGWHGKAAELAAQAGDPAFPVWAMTGDDGQVVGVTSLYEQSSPLLWPDEAERAEPAIFLATTITDPALSSQRPGSLIAWWALHQAAAQGRTWVRRGTGPYPGLVAYYRDVQGWSVVRTVEHGLGRRAPDAMVWQWSTRPVVDHSDT
ncbi:hypothetical protein [Nonomuraea sp. NPDC003804]|uniref:hypothetical protein n=1 Tax=Nonomuraea sp. NPDC003804 TaxID=3154547 RepID=UPI0033ABE4CC